MKILKFVLRAYRSTSVCRHCGVEITRTPCWSCGK